MKTLADDDWINGNKHQRYIEGKQTLFIIKILILIPRKISKRKMATHFLFCLWLRLQRG
jgi:hypothetical protein